MSRGSQPEELPDVAAQGHAGEHGALVPGGAAGAGEVL